MLVLEPKAVSIVDPSVIVRSFIDRVPLLIVGADGFRVRWWSSVGGASADTLRLFLVELSSMK